MGQALQLHDRNPTGWSQVIQETTVTSSATTVSGFWVYGLQRIAGAVNPTSTASVRYYGYDALGSVRITTNTTTGAIDFEFYPDAYGRTIASTPSGSFAERFRYAGEEWDADLGLYYLRARYYAPEYGRFWTMDSYEGSQSDPLSLHKYLYAQGNPVNLTDPSGHNAEGSVIGQLAITTIQRMGQGLTGAANSTAYWRASYTLYRAIKIGQQGLLYAEFALACPRSR